MNQDLINEIPPNEPIVIPDECGDSIWDAVLQQETKACPIKKAFKGVTALLNDIEKMHVSEEIKG